MRSRGAQAPALLVLALAGCTRQAEPSAPANALVPPAPPTSPTAHASGHQHALVQEPLCDPGETETCVCEDESTGSRRCNARGTAFSPCDACPKPRTCGTRTCDAYRIGLVALTLPACCPAEAPDHCGVDATFVAKSYGISVGCLQFEAPGTLDTACPSVDVPVPERGNTTLPGCRTPSGGCGYLVDLPDVINLGCVEVS